MDRARSRGPGTDPLGDRHRIAGRTSLSLVAAGFGVVGLALVTGFWLGRAAPPPAGLASSPASTPELVPESVERPSAADDREPLRTPELPHADPAPSPEAPKRSWKDALYVPSRFPLVVAEEGVPIDPSVWATIGPLTRTPVPDSVFDAKYPPGTTLGTLRGTAGELEGDVLRTMRDLSQALYDSGQYEEVQFPVNEDGEVLVSFYLGTSGGPSMPKFSCAPGLEANGPGREKIIWHRFDEHADLYDKLDEVDYLRRRYAREKAR